jgi:gliding motility-associated-like protein
VNLELNFTGTVKAYFYENNHTVLFDVDPPGKGYIKLDDQKIEEYPDIRELPAEFTYSLEALTDEVYYKFSHWSATHHDFEPDFTSSLSSILLNQSDAITAHFVEIPNYTVTFMTNPKDVGSIRFDDQLITNFPYTERYVGEVPYALESIVPNAWEFEQWEFVMRPDLPGRIYPSLQYTPIRNDTIILHMSERFSDVFVPTAFSPNGDGVNELIKVEGLEISADEFEWVIYSRFGDLVFETNDINNAWNGSKLNSSYYCPVGVYTYLLKYKNAINNENKNKSGSIMLIR